MYRLRGCQRLNMHHPYWAMSILFFLLAFLPRFILADNLSATTTIPPAAAPAPTLDLSAALQPMQAVSPEDPSTTSVLGNERLIQKPWWFNLGLGIGAITQSRGGLSADVSVDYAPKPDQLLTIRATGVNNTGGVNPSTLAFAMTGGMARLDTLVGGVGDLGPMYGYRDVTSWGYLSASAGLAWAMGRKAPAQPGEIGQGFNTIGIPLETDAFYDVNSHIALGLIGFADVNPQASYVGITLAVQVGQLKEQS